MQPTSLTLKRFWKISRTALLILIGLIVSVWLLVQTTPVQNFLVRQVTSRLSKDLNTTVRVKNVNFALFNSMLLEGTLVEDLHNDTLLYAGAVRVNITDWFFFADKIELKYIGLTNAVIHLNRTDSIWNYHFLLDYFTSPNPQPSNTKSVNLDLRKVEFDDVVIVQRDEWRGEDLTARLQSLDIEADGINLEKRVMRIRSMVLNQPYFSIYDYPGRRVRRPSYSSEPEIFVNDTNYLRWNPGKWDIAVNSLTLNNGGFQSDVKTQRAIYEWFDGAHILFRDINAQFSNLKFVQDSITAQLELSASERSGFQVKKLTANVKMHPEAMEFHQLDLLTNRSHLKNFFAMRYATFDDMGYFEDRVRMEGNFDDAMVSSDDIAFFAPELREWKKTITINGKASGTVENLNAKNILIEAGTDTYLKGNISIAGITDIHKTYIDLEAENFRTTYKDAIAIVPQLRHVDQPRLDRLEYLRFRGNFTGFLSDFVTYGTIETKLGTLVTDLNMKLPERAVPRYAGNIRTSGFDMGKLLDNGSLGKIIFEGKVNGSGLRLAALNAQLDGDIKLLEFNQYGYQGITVRGTVSKRLFNGEFISNDPNLQARLDGLVDFSKELPEFNFEASVTRADLLALNLMNEQVDFFGKFNFNFQGSDIDNFLGTARVYDASLLRSGIRISFDSLYVESKIIDSNKVITAVSNEFDAAIAGEFSIQDLPASFQTFLNKYYPAYIKPSKKLLNDENFSFVVTTKNVDEYIDLLHPHLSGFNNSTITGRINTRENLLDLNAEIPHFSFKDISVYDLQLNASGISDSLRLRTEIANVYINDSLNFPGTIINLNSASDLSAISISTSANQTLNSANLNARVQTLPKGIRLRFHESDFDINGKKWIIEKDGEITLLEDEITANGVKLYNGLQEISMLTLPSGVTNKNDVKVNLQRVNIGDFTPYFVKSNRLEGLISGTITVVDPFGKLNVDVNTTAEQFRLDDDSVGRVDLKGKYYNTLREANFSAVSNNQDYKFEVQGIYHLGDSVRNENLDIFTSLKDTKIDVLQQYLTGVFSDITGYATGALRISGPSENLKYTGSILLSDAWLRVKYTNVKYRIPFANVELKEDQIDFGTFTFEDELNNKAKITRGILYHQGFDELGFDFAMNSGKLLVLATNNTNSDDSYYGNVIARVNMTLNGPLNDMVMNITGEPADSSNLFINTKSGKQSDQADFVVWKVYGREMQAAREYSGENLTVNLEVTANNYANMYVILDELTGDVIQATGKGNLKIRATTDGEFTINGRYDIDRGNYNFNFESLLRKPFKLREDVANYIQWSGDPNNAMIKIEAQYEAENVRFSDLGSAFKDMNLSADISKYRGKVLVIATLTEELLSPEISFKIELPQSSPLRNNFMANNLLQTIQNDQNELNRQVAFLVVFNTFGPLQSSSQGNIANQAFEGIVVGSISGVLSSTLSRQFSSVFQKIFNDKSIRVNFNAQLYSGTNLLENFNRNTLALDRTNVNFSVQKNLFNERLTFSFGSAVDFGLTSSQPNSGNLPFLPDINAEWKVTPDGRVVLTFFYRDSYNFAPQTGIRQNRSGASISFRREFERIGELLRSKKNKS